ncbi:hypothetical protein L596_010111 [Steinernema carpocapsae]|uniref:G-protein coupled receptors family 1 profile domain-containing protein n=1 Tax=Steinernema carpocapsae TaxID=34508 RepID=A0A4U5PHM6_STECR|nr:hypothetical protein L596_010111 [Steinernema carpocapsae]
MLILEYPKQLPKILQVDHYLAAVLGILLNTIVVIGLSLKRSNKLGSYRWFLLAHSVNDLVSAVSMGILELTFDYSYNTMIMIVNGPLTVFGSSIGKLCFMLFSSSMFLNISLLALTFAYRYVQICKKQYLYKFSELPYIGCIALAIAGPLVAMEVSVVYAYTFSYKFTVQAETNMFDVRALYVQDVTCIAFYITCVLFVSVAFVSYTLIFFCCKAIFSYLKQSESALTQKTKSTQKLFTIVLLLQSVTPILTSTLPACGMIIGIVLQLEVRWITWVMSATFVWLPVLNAETQNKSYRDFDKYTTAQLEITNLVRICMKIMKRMDQRAVGVIQHYKIYEDCL